MVDLETLDNLPTAMIVSIGAVCFDPDQPASTDFDVTILENAYRRSSMPVPWKYSQVRDWTTLRKLTRTEKAPNSCAHNALADAQTQVAGFREAWSRLKTGGVL